MNLRKALPIALKADKAATSDAVCILSSLETYYFELFLKTAWYESSQRGLRIQKNGFGNLALDLLQYRSDNNQPVILLLEWEDFWPGSSLRSAAALPAAPPENAKQTPFYTQLVEFISMYRGPIYLIPPLMEMAPVHANPAVIEQFRLNLLSSLHQLGATHRQLTLCASHELQSLPQSEWTDSGLNYKMGWPYSLEASHQLATAAHRQIGSPYSRKKLLITDLDDTLWHGLIGEQGAGAVEWEMGESGYKHRLYQKCLNRISDEGVLLAVCSKNETAVALAGLARPDLLLNSAQIIQKEIGWGPKSEAVTRILSALNIDARDALFVDDNPTECAEVMSAVEGICTLQFPKNNKEVAPFFSKLNSHFHARKITEDDLRRVELYQSREMIQQASSSAGNIETFLQELKMSLLVEQVTDAQTERPLQLINKTNQFNLNGLRENEESWAAFFKRGGLAYQFRLMDRIADHGVCGVIAFEMEAAQTTCRVTHFVLSCRVFSRGVEHAILDWLRHQSPAQNCHQWLLHYSRTERNRPITNFLNKISTKKTVETCQTGDCIWLPIETDSHGQHRLRIV
jgi:FkbH-like protein